jgi:hypothetical protein
MALVFISSTTEQQQQQERHQINSPILQLKKHYSLDMV